MALYRRTRVGARTHARTSIPIARRDLYLCVRSHAIKPRARTETTKKPWTEEHKHKHKKKTVTPPLGAGRRWGPIKMAILRARARAALRPARTARIYRRLKCRLAAISGINGRVKSHSRAGHYACVWNAAAGTDWMHKFGGRLARRAAA